jgi:hypothetical protein
LNEVFYTIQNQSTPKKSFYEAKRIAALRMLLKSSHPFNVILRREATKNLVVRRREQLTTKNEILRGAEGPERSRGAQDDIIKGRTTHGCHSEERSDEESL